MNEMYLSIIMYVIICVVFLIAFKIYSTHEERQYKRLLNKKTIEVISHINSTTNNTIYEVSQLLEQTSDKVDKNNINKLMDKYNKEIDQLNSIDSNQVFSTQDLIDLCESFIIDLKNIIDKSNK